MRKKTSLNATWKFMDLFPADSKEGQFWGWLRKRDGKTKQSRLYFRLAETAASVLTVSWMSNENICRFESWVHQPASEFILNISVTGVCDSRVQDSPKMKYISNWSDHMPTIFLLILMIIISIIKTKISFWTETRIFKVGQQRGIGKLCWSMLTVGVSIWKFE